MAFGEENRYQNFIDIILEDVHDFDELEYRTIKLVYDRTNSRIIEGTQKCLHGWCKMLTPENATDDFLTVRKWEEELMLNCKTVEDPDTLTYFTPGVYPSDNSKFCEWMDDVPVEDELYIRITDIKKRDCSCKPCKFLNAYIEMMTALKESTI